jgi:tRNA A37 threonylcarbamoyladenosine biosynthesis protein TsaE
MGEGLEETLKDLRRKTTLPTPTFVIINDYKEEK